MQFHTSESLAAKELTHKAYERTPTAAVLAPEERREMKAYQRRVNALLVTPPGTAEIKDFPERAMTDKITYYAIVDESS